MANKTALINGVEYAWGDIVLLLGGVPVSGVTAIDYDDTQEVVNIYGAGNVPVARGRGRITCTGKIKLLASEVVALQSSSPTGRLQDLGVFDVQVSYLPDNGKIVHDVIRNCQFSKNVRSIKEGDTNSEVELDLNPSHIEWGKL